MLFEAKLEVCVRNCRLKHTKRPNLAKALGSASCYARLSTFYRCRTFRIEQPPILRHGNGIGGLAGFGADIEFVRFAPVVLHAVKMTIAFAAIVFAHKALISAHETIALRLFVHRSSIVC